MPKYIARVYSSVMFIQAARDVVKEASWALKIEGLAHFPAIAKEILLASDCQKKFNFQELIDASFNSKLTDQHFKNFEFSDLPITIARTDDCFLDLYCWRKHHTAIHDHNFAGAFMCLSGKNLNVEYEFKTERELGPYHALGKLTSIKETTLTPGMAESISPWDAYIHQSFHQAQVTVNLCLRTPDLGEKPLTSFFLSGLKQENHLETQNKMERLLRLMELSKLNLTTLEFTHSDAMTFLINTHFEDCTGTGLNILREHFNQKLKVELQLDIPALMQQHSSFSLNCT